MTFIKAGTKIEFCEGAGWTVMQDIKPLDVITVSMFEAYGGAPPPVADHPIPKEISTLFAPRTKPAPKCPAEQLKKDCDQGCDLGPCCPRMDGI